ncbi:hypothetical protein R1flu_020675 [Riccia fluitans]|uniref:Uncharacterized protein n=1 Tax=Riccia fluitans TaxID=41844 RepID=A0ABD1ZM63_9MARC
MSILQVVCSSIANDHQKRNWWVFPKSDSWWEILVKQGKHESHTNEESERGKSTTGTFRALEVSWSSVVTCILFVSITYIFSVGVLRWTVSKWTSLHW